MDDPKKESSGHLRSCVLKADALVKELTNYKNNTSLDTTETNLRKVLLFASVCPPSKESCNLSLTITFNLALHRITEGIRSSDGRGKQGALCAAVDGTLVRVLQWVSQRPSAPVCYSVPEVEDKLVTLAALCDDPLLHFRLLPVMGRLLAMMSVWCLYGRQEPVDPASLNTSLKCLMRMRRDASLAVLQEPLPMTQGFLLCESDPSLLVSLPTVGDVIDLVLMALTYDLALCGGGDLEFDRDLLLYQADVKLEDWRWLYCLIKCGRLTSIGSHAEALALIQVTLGRPQDPESKSLLLCQLAKCYVAQKYNQLAIQSYKAALQADPGNLAILACLATLHGTLEAPLAQLEVLRVLAKKVKDREQANGNPDTSMPDMDTIVARVCRLVPNVTYIQAVHNFAKHCFKLKRHVEAADQYMDLLTHLQDQDKVHMFPEESPVCLKTLVIECVEALYKAQRFQEGIDLCEEFLPCLSSQDNHCDESLADLDLCGKSEPYSRDSRTNLVGSEDFLFDSPKKGQDTDLADMPDDSSSMTIKSPTPRRKRKSARFSVEVFKSLHESSRKRKLDSSTRNETLSVSVNRDQESERLSQALLPARLLVCQADCEVGVGRITHDSDRVTDGSEGLTDRVNSYLNRALDIMFQYKHTIKGSDKSSEPSAKRARLNSDGNEYGLNFNDTWTSLVVSTSLRLATLCLDKGDISSVLTSCHLISQLDTGNMSAEYMRTQALRSRAGQGSHSWLEKRGVSAGVKVKEDIRAKLKSLKVTTDQGQGEWWSVSEAQMMELDLLCLEGVDS